MKTSLLKLIRITTVPISLDKLLEGQLKYLSKSFDVLGVSSPPMPYLNEIIKREGIRGSAIEMKRGISPIKDFISLIYLIFLFKKEQPHIVHSITPKAGLLSMLAAKYVGVPIRVHTFTGLIFPTTIGIKRLLLINMDRLLCWAATQIYPEGKGIKYDLENNNITKKPLRVLANGNVNGIDTHHFDPELFTEEAKYDFRKELGISATDFVYVFVGRLVGDKGINELVQAFSEICRLKQSRTTKLLLVGPLETELDPLEASTLKVIKENTNIIAVGYQQDVRPYLAISDALVFPSYREGFPNVVMQAGAMGLPSIVTEINGCNEIIEDSKNGLIIPRKNIEALVNAMIKMIDDKQLYLKLKQNARPMIVDRYQREEVWQALLEEYKSLLQEKGLSLDN